LQEPNYLSLLRHAPGLLLREDLLSVEIHVKGSRTAHLDVGGNFQLTLDIFFQAPGLSFDVTSHKAALDID
jgi:hypothetical protein